MLIGVLRGQLGGDLVVPLDELLVSATPSSTLPSTVLVSSSTGSCGNIPALWPGMRRTSPLEGCSNPAIIRSSVDLPIPFGPTTPIFAPGKNPSVTSSRTTLPS